MSSKTHRDRSEVQGLGALGPVDSLALKVIVEYSGILN